MESGFREWMLVDRDLSETYVNATGRTMRAMERSGVDFARFKSGEAARDEVRPWLAAKKLGGQMFGMENAQKALNLYAAFLRLQDRDGRPTHWDLAKVPRRRLEPYTADEVRAVLGHLGQGWKGLRRGAMVYLFAHTGLRKGEVYRLQAEDFDHDRGAVRLRRPEKDGTPRWVNLPDSAWDATSRLYRYLVAREQRTGREGPLWLTCDGVPMSFAGFSNEMYDIRARCGVPVNFNRWRHSRGTVAVELQIPRSVQQEEWGHGDERSTGHYMHTSQESRRVVLAAHGAPGYLPRDRPRELVDAIALV